MIVIGCLVGLMVLAAIFANQFEVAGVSQKELSRIAATKTVDVCGDCKKLQMGRSIDNYTLASGPWSRCTASWTRTLSDGRIRDRLSRFSPACEEFENNGPRICGGCGRYGEVEKTGVFGCLLTRQNLGDNETPHGKRAIPLDRNTEACCWGGGKYGRH